MVFYPPSNPQRGQVVLMLILTVVVALTLGLGIYMNSLRELSVTNTEESSERAFAVAEAGVEDLLQQDIATIVNNIQSNSNLTVDVGSLTADVKVAQHVELNVRVKQNDVATVQLVGDSSNARQVDIFWSQIADPSQNPATCQEGNKQSPAALVIDRWSRSGTSINTTRYTLNPASCSGLVSNFSDASSGNAAGFASQITLGAGGFGPVIDADPSDGNYDIALRIQPLYNDASLLVRTADANPLPLQAIDFVSKTSVADSNETRAIQVNRSLSDLPSIFDYVLFSNNQIIKN